MTDPDRSSGARPGAAARSTVYGREGIVACEHPLAAVEGIRVLDAGGSAADACVAMAAVLAVVCPMMTGLGGDAFALYYEGATGRVHGLNGAGRAPGGASLEGVRARGHDVMPERGGLPVTVPGAVRMWEDLRARFGRLRLARLLEPARRLAEDGFPVAEVSARMWGGEEALLREDAAASAAFLPGGHVPRAGEVVRLRDLARTLGAVAADGPEAFYGGEVARRLARAVQAAGGWLSEADLAVHRSDWVEPITTEYRGLTVHEIGPPTQGLAALEMLNLLEGHDLATRDPLGAERIHLEAEAKRIAFADVEACLGDPDFVDVPVAALLSAEHTARRRAELRPGRAAPSSAAATPAASDTVYLCAVDSRGDGCSFINSLYHGFGSGVVAPGTGVCLHNRGVSFRLDAEHPNALAPGKRPAHTIIPALATESGALWATFGVMGGFMQPQGHVQLLVNLRDRAMSPQAAVEHPRHFHDAGVLLVEDRVPEAERERLRAWGHDVAAGASYAALTGGAQVIRVLPDGVRAGGSDPRKDGCALAQ